ncbi:MAG TPA: 16S rRNA (guanine(966)-N(2))-methyltransferase RsmD [Acidimicrobiaceae bacterium]|nr:16S rRNA (guanine(966)-N(2))-methyltransferase RsmD [Acidimicrobiaceae bacterium]HAX05186.1 16S rRNA (guanine(966)-N(2))-methyltransferase RsmD [Acidimicrobiaceae bacterium]|tara:strand:- start:123 stop:644 length:522 start_codon:yes stop_codon:yes gene_type:complete
MRIVGGELSGRRILAPQSGKVRPTSDRAREAIFNMLFSLGFPSGSRVVDLFAGSGALGLEALSRGAAETIFIDNDPVACRTISQNLETLGLQGQVIHGDVLQRFGSLDVDLVLADPPYGYEGWNELIELAGQALVVAESDAPLSSFPGWELLRSRTYGKSVVTILSRSETNKS